MTLTTSYRGRFAPTPSGPLHLGSLLTALASFLQARSQNGAWLLRIDDLDTPRNVPGADSTIQRQLEAHGLHWDDAPRYQSQHLAEYQAALEQLEAAKLLYACNCTRATLARESRIEIDGPVYSGRCRSASIHSEFAARRVRVSAETLMLDDPWQGHLQRHASNDIGDFVVRRSDGQIGYQLACVVDEAAQKITEVVRGADLIGSSFRQCWLQKTLAYASPQYRHAPLLIGRDGLKLSKQNHARALDRTQTSANLLRCLHWLGQNPPADWIGLPPCTLLDLAIQHWNPRYVSEKSAQILED